jgi:16S rRNA (adenine1518-N6/adenine1519-N6)-dimethyltransferase
MDFVRPKKSLGQHFLKDDNIARKITESLSASSAYVLEIGPGTGILTRLLMERANTHLKVIEIDRDSIAYLEEHFPELKDDIITGDFLKLDRNILFPQPLAVIGNFPYNISSQILFRVIENRDMVPEVVCMLQREVAQRLASPPGSKQYGILSVLLQAWYKIEYLFTVSPQVFVPPPKVTSAVIRLSRNAVTDLGCDQVLFHTVVKTAFNQRRKTLHNAIKPLCPDYAGEFAGQRAEQLSVMQFVKLTLEIALQNSSLPVN